ncbi:MAG: rhodanese-like domain-containing protein, partial [Methanobacteriota archaeon]
MPELVPAGPVSPEELKRRLDARDEIVLLDVRTPEEFADWHIRGAWNVPLHELASRVSEVPKGREVVTVCAHGVRSGRAAAFLSKAGFRARNLRGGMVGWNAVYDVAVVPVGDSLRKTEVLQFRRVGKGCLSYLVAGGGEAVVVDATVDIDVFLEAAR